MFLKTLKLQDKVCKFQFVTTYAVMHPDLYMYYTAWKSNERTATVHSSKPMMVHIFRPHSEGMGKVLFPQASVCSEGGVPLLYPITPPSTGPMSFPGGGVPHPVPNEGYPHLVLMGGTQSGLVTPHQELDGGNPIRIGWGYPHQDWMGIPPSLLGLDRGTSHQDWMGVPPWETEQQNEYLLHSRQYATCVQRRRTFLFLRVS